MMHFKNLVFALFILLLTNTFSGSVPAVATPERLAGPEAKHTVASIQGYFITYGMVKVFENYIYLLEHCIDKPHRKTEVPGPNIPSFIAGYCASTLKEIKSPDIFNIAALYCGVYGATKFTEALLNHAKKALLSKPLSEEEKIKISHPCFFSFMAGGITGFFKSN